MYISMYFENMELTKLRFHEYSFHEQSTKIESYEYKLMSQ